MIEKKIMVLLTLNHNNLIGKDVKIILCLYYNE